MFFKRNIDACYTVVTSERGEKKMKKIIAMILIISCCLTLPGCGKSRRIRDIHVEELEELTGQTVSDTRTTNCALCKGSGVCNHCNGEAFRNGRRCSWCDGTGKCSYCEGIGQFKVVEMGGKDYTLCGSCHGDGACRVCGGSGRYSAVIGTYIGKVESDCMLCHGSGKCNGCKGAGWKELRGF